MPDELLVDDGAAEGHLVARLNWNGDIRRVAFGEIPSGDDVRAEGLEKAGRHRVDMDGPFGHGSPVRQNGQPLTPAAAAQQSGGSNRRGLDVGQAAEAGEQRTQE